MNSRHKKSTALLAALASCLAPVSAQEWPGTPFTTEGRDMLDVCGNPVLFAGVNWPGAAETMLPEGLSHSSIANIVSKIKELGMNVIRLTYAIEMIDDIFEDSPNNSLNGTLINGVGEGSAPGVLAAILANNPQFTAETTRLEVFDAVAEECARQEIWVHLDNHVSRAAWCCPAWDGNAWFGDRYFDVYNWTRGLGFMAEHAQQWDALVSMSLRNELRPSTTGVNTTEPYNWASWMNNMVPAATAIHGNNSLPLIFFSGINWDTTDNFFIVGDVEDGVQFIPSDYDFEDKIVAEIHNYANAAGCDSIAPGLYTGAYGAMNLSDPTYKNHMPVVFSEFGFDMTDGSDMGAYAQCIKNSVLNAPGGPGSWMQWVLAGSYYTRYGCLDCDETWGLLNHNWSDWRNQTVIDEYVLPFVQGTPDKTV